MLLDNESEPFLADFGVATTLDAARTHTQALVGTIPYMSPEQIAGGQLGPWSDVWSLGVVLFELLTHKLPFRGKTIDELMTNIRTQEPKEPRQLRPALHRDLEAVILKCLEKDPNRRYPTALRLAIDLEHIRLGLPTQARPLSLPQRTWRKVRRHWKVAVATMAAACLLALAWVVYAKTRPTPVTPKDPYAWETEVVQTFDKKGKLTLIGEHGGPLGFRWLLGEDKTKATGKDDESFWVGAHDDFALMQLMPNIPVDAYELDADIKHDTDAGSGSVGLFVCDTILPRIRENDPVPPRAVMAFTFNEFSAPAEGKASGRFELRHFDRMDQGANSPGTSKRFSFDRGPRADWRHLHVKVTVDGIEGAFDKIEMPKQLFDKLYMPRNPDGQPRRLNPHGGLGLWVYMGSASFRNVEIVAKNEQAK